MAFLIRMLEKLLARAVPIVPLTAFGRIFIDFLHHMGPASDKLKVREQIIDCTILMHFLGLVLQGCGAIRGVPNVDGPYRCPKAE